ncbi:MAG: copper amine oxidase N-terminal domain-containing protein, partial [Lachnospiraceae bacterium]|nr:copper amine oxidase N-terminal domain-containing protein [Lachnospiraceae bacterium]
ITDSDPDTWSWNDKSGKCGMFSLYGLDPAPEKTVGKSTKDTKDTKDIKDIKYSDIKVFLDGKELSLNDDKGKKAEPVMIDGTVYLPAVSLVEALDHEVKWDKEGKAIYIGKLPDEKAPSHCWVLTDTVHEVDKDESYANRTWHYDYEDIDNGGRYVIDYTFRYNKEYAHYIAIGEATNIPSCLYPGKYATIDLKTYAEDVVGTSAWGIPVMDYIQYEFKEPHPTYDYSMNWTNVNENEPVYYNCADGTFEWKVKALFPEGKPGDSLKVTLKYHRGDLHPIKTIWTYVWSE